MDSFGATIQKFQNDWLSMATCWVDGVGMASDIYSYHEVQQDGTTQAQINLHTYGLDSHNMDRLDNILVELCYIYNKTKNA